MRQSLAKNPGFERLKPRTAIFFPFVVRDFAHPVVGSFFPRMSGEMDDAWPVRVRPHREQEKWMPLVPMR